MYTCYQSLYCHCITGDIVLQIPSRGRAVEVVGVSLFKLLRKNIIANRTVDSECEQMGRNGRYKSKLQYR